MLIIGALSTRKIQEPAASKITQQKGPVNYREDSIKDSITHCGVAVINSAITTAADKRTQ